MSTLNAIFAMSQNGVIGDGDTIPWTIPEDLKMFSELTKGQKVVMGRETWVSLPERYRPLPGRDNYVLSRTPGYTADGATVLDSFDKVVELDRLFPGQVWVIGGKVPIELAMPHVETLFMTLVQADYRGDRKAPDIFEPGTLNLKRKGLNHITISPRRAKGSNTRYKVYEYRVNMAPKISNPESFNHI
jgi:dihydrofolate reductase